MVALANRLADASLILLSQASTSSVAHVLGDPSCQRFSAPGIVGVIPYRESLGCVVGIGDPVCAVEDREALSAAFERACAARKVHPLFAAASKSFAERCIAHGYAAVEFGEELVFDPRRDAQAGARGRELRKKLKRARDAGAVIHERTDARPELDNQLEEVARRWRCGRRGPQVFITPVLLFSDANRRRWFYVEHGGAIVGVLTMVRKASRAGWVLEHVLATPESPTGTSELLVAEALAALGREGCSYATFGPTTLARVGNMVGVGVMTRLFVRALFSAFGHVLHLDSKARYQRKFQACASEPSYLLFSQKSVGLRETLSLLAAFNVSL